MGIFDDLRACDCESVMLAHDADSGLRAILAIHSTRRGPAFGGIRTMHYATEVDALADALRLARAMTFKAAAADLPAGGGKCVVMLHDGMMRDAAFHALGRTVQQLHGTFFTGLDVGTTAADLRALGAETVYAATELDFGKATARGVLAAIRAGLAHATGSADPQGRTVAIQGLGAVGAELARLLHAQGARLIVADANAEVASAVSAETGAEVVTASRVLVSPCDVVAPCALGAVLTPGLARGLRCRVIAGSANNQLAAPGVDGELRAAGIVWVPDFVANAGALIKGVTEHVQGHEVGLEVVDRIFDTVTRVLTDAGRDQVTTLVAAESLARSRLA